MNKDYKAKPYIEVIYMDRNGIDIAAIVTGFGSLGGCIAAGVKEGLKL